MNDVIVTGASGFIGSSLIKRLPEANAVKNDDIHRGFARDSDQVFFLSTYGNMAHHTEHWKMVNANVEDVIAALILFKGWFCYMSSSSVTLPVQTPYSRTKRAAEEILQSLPELKSCIVRPYSVVGRGEQKEHLIPTLIRSCMEGEEMPFDPYPVHDFVNVSDVVDGLILLADKQATGVHEFGGCFGYTNEAVLEIVQDVCGRRANIKTSETMRDYDTLSWYCRKPSPFFKSSKTLLQSISEMVEAYKNERA